MNKFLNKHEPIYETTGNLPHWTQYGKITFVTFRLADSLPQNIIDNIKTEYESIKQQLLKEGNLKELEFLKVKKHNQLEKNHIHLLIEPKEQATIQQIIKTIKSVSAHKINSYINQTGSIWQKEYFDRIIRNEDHYNRVINYIRQNPSHCSPSEYILWEWGRPRPR
ncbi:transposase [Prevotella sp.]|uniref:transposase n=1 Tax=Prevotella sp. TaxID=59823 RepID=UPI003FF0A1DB